MTSVDTLKQQILSYFGTIASPASDTLTIRDFNAQLMSGMFAAEERDALATVLRELVAAGLLQERAPNAYGLTPQGVVAAREARAAKDTPTRR